MDQAIKFTVEGTRPVSSMPFLDTVVTPQQNRTLSITVYRKPTHTDQYLHCDIHHHVAGKYSIINTVVHRPRQFLPYQNCLELKNNI